MFIRKRKELKTAHKLAANIPLGLHDVNPDKIEAPDELFRYAESVYEALKCGVGVTLYGDFRTGKSSAATWLLFNAMIYYKTAFFVECYRLIEQTLNNSVVDNLSGETFKDACIDRDIIVLDDVGAARSTDFMVETLEKIIRSRASQNKSTIITTNLQPTSLKTALGTSTHAVVDGSNRHIKISGSQWQNALKIKQQAIFGDVK